MRSPLACKGDRFYLNNWQIEQEFTILYNGNFDKLSLFGYVRTGLDL
jgi:cytochrome c biogenesis protein ResB